MTGELFYESDLYHELEELTRKLDPWYDVPEIKWYSVYINIDGKMAFDIFADEIIYYEGSRGHTIPEEAMIIIREIQEKLNEIDKEMD